MFKITLSQPELMRAIILAFRGTDDFTPAIGEANRIHEPELLKRLLHLFNCQPSNMTISQAISEIRNLVLTAPEIKDTAVWYICGQDADGAKFKFRITAKDYIIGGEKGRFLPQSVEEIKAYELARIRDAEKQLKNAEAARIAAAYFLSTTAELTFF